MNDDIQELIDGLQALVDARPPMQSGPPLDPKNLDIGDLLDLLKNFDFETIVKLLPILGALIPGLGPIIPIILQILSIFSSSDQPQDVTDEGIA